MPLEPRVDVYSLALLTAMLLLGAALVARLGRGRERSAAAWGFGISALAFSAFALTFHWQVGHAHGSAEALAPLGFLAAHRALVAVLLIAAGLSVLRRKTR